MIKVACLASIFNHVTYCYWTTHLQESITSLEHVTFKQSDDEATAMLELWGKRGAPSSPSLPGPLWPGLVAPDWVLSIDQIVLNCVITLN